MCVTRSAHRSFIHEETHNVCVVSHSSVAQSIRMSQSNIKASGCDRVDVFSRSAFVLVTKGKTALTNTEWCHESNKLNFTILVL